MEARTLSWPRAAGEEPPEEPVSLEEVMEEARAKGHAEGFAAGEAEGRKAFDQQLEEALAPVRALHEQLNHYRLELEDAELEVVSTFVLQAFSTLLGMQLEKDSQAFADVLADAMTALPHAGEISVRLHPDTLEAMKRRLPEVTFVEDSDLNPGAMMLDAGVSAWRADPLDEFSAVLRESF